MFFKYSITYCKYSGQSRGRHVTRLPIPTSRSRNRKETSNRPYQRYCGRPGHNTHSPFDPQRSYLTTLRDQTYIHRPTAGRNGPTEPNSNHHATYPATTSKRNDMSLMHLRPAPPLRRGLLLSQPLLPRTSTNTYATHSSASRRRNVTVLSDDGRYTWGELSGKEKVARATQQSFNFVVVLAGVVLTVSTLCKVPVR